MKIKRYVNGTISFLDSWAKIGSGLIVILALAGLSLPNSLWSKIEAIIASKQGITGFVYYEVGKNRGLTNDGQLFLLSDSINAFYQDIKKGDKLIANSEVRLRIKPNKEYPRVFELQKRDCVIVIEDPANEVHDLKDAVSGGWLHIATTACGIFK